MKVGKTWAAGLMFVVSLAAVGPAWADPATDTYNQGTRLLETGRAEEAIVYFDRAALPSVGDPPGHSGRGAAWSKKGDFAEAIIDLDREIELDPLNPWAHGMRGRHLRLRLQAG